MQKNPKQNPSFFPDSDYLSSGKKKILYSHFQGMKSGSAGVLVFIDLFKSAEETFVVMAQSPPVKQHAHGSVPGHAACAGHAIPQEGLAQWFPPTGSGTAARVSDSSF